MKNPWSGSLQYETLMETPAYDQRFRNQVPTSARARARSVLLKSLAVGIPHSS